MTDVLEVLLELEYLQADLARRPLKVDSLVQYMTLLERLVDIMGMILKAITSKDCLAQKEQIESGEKI